MPDSLPAVLGFGVIFLIVGGLGAGQLGLTASLIFLIAAGALLAFGGITALVAVRRRAAEPDRGLPGTAIPHP